MTQPLHRRGLFRSLFAALLGGSAAPAAGHGTVAGSDTIVLEASGLPPGLSINHQSAGIHWAIRNGTTGTKHPPHAKAG